MQISTKNLVLRRLTFIIDAKMILTIQTERRDLHEKTREQASCDCRHEKNG